MSLLLWSDPFEYRPSRLLDQHFGVDLEPEDFLAPIVPRILGGCPWYRSLVTPQNTGTVNFDKDKFQVNLDVQQFKPEEISVKVQDNTITVEGKHEEKQDEHGYISRHFVRKYVIPKGHDLARVDSKLSSDGVLSISAPKVSEQGQGEKAIPVIQTGQPSKPIEQNKENEKQEKSKL